MVFSEDSFNKKIPDQVHSRVLIGNWFEESVLQTTVGEARSVPQRHIKRAGLLRDFTKRPSQVRQLDDTFERVCGSATVAAVEDRFATSNGTAFQSRQPAEHPQAPRRALREAEFLAAAQKALAAKPEEPTFTPVPKVASPEAHPPQKRDPRPVKWMGKYTEFTHPIELQRRGGRFKDESGIRQSH